MQTCCAVVAASQICYGRTQEVSLLLGSKQGLLHKQVNSGQGRTQTCRAAEVPEGVAGHQ